MKCVRVIYDIQLEGTAIIIQSYAEEIRFLIKIEDFLIHALFIYLFIRERNFNEIA